MKFPFIVALALLSTLSTEAFQRMKVSPRSPMTATTSRFVVSEPKVEPPTNPEGLTDLDEEVLFGDPTQPHPTQTSRHRHRDRSGNLLVDKTQPLNPLDHSTNNPTLNKLHTMRDALEYCPQLWKEMAQIHPNQVALIDEHLCDERLELTFAQMEETVRTSAAIFQNLGVQPGVHVAILGENSARWLQVDHGIQLAGGASAVRGADAPMDELRYIYEHSDSAGIAVLQGPRLLQKLYKDAQAKGLLGLGLSNAKHGNVQHVLLMHKEKKDQAYIEEMAAKLNIQISYFGDLLASTGSVQLSQLPTLTRDDLSTIVYTSGTTGNPKGVMLTHGNMLHQMTHRLAPTKPYEESEPLPDETMVSLLPVWHITERTFELWMLSRSCKVVYSSIRTFRNDMAKHKPEWLVLVPRVLEKIAAGVQDKFSNGSAAVKILSQFFTTTSSLRAKHLKISNGLVVDKEPPSGLRRLASKVIVAGLAPLNAVGDKLVWSKVQDGFGGQLKTIISGGSALAGSLEEFYETAGLQILVGYGLTECSPLLAYRRKDGNLVTAGCCGKACLDTEVRIVDPDRPATATSDRPSLPLGQVGVVIGRGPQIMKGYYKNPEATAKAIDAFGWFDTGDLGRINPATGDVILTGRVKDTIVLSNGENIEPQPIEDALLSGSDCIEQVMLTGQDGRRLIAITVLSPTELANAGYVTADEAAKWQAANEAINSPTCTDEEYQTNVGVLTQASSKLRENDALKRSLLADMKEATSVGFRKWEQVGDVHIILEPFAMANGQLTQSYKVKRDAVLSRYGDELPE